MNSKNELRTVAKEIRKNLNIEKLSSILREKLINHKFYKDAKNVLIYYPLNYEINLLPLLNDSFKNFYLPRVNGKNLEICPYHNGDKLLQSPMGIYEPVSENTDINNIDLIIVPALMADKNGYRIGYGGGFYDRLLKNNKNAKTVTLLPSELITENLIHEEHDIKIDCILHT